MCDLQKRERRRTIENLYKWGYSIITFTLRGRGIHQNVNVCEQREWGVTSARTWSFCENVIIACPQGVTISDTKQRGPKFGTII